MTPEDTQALGDAVKQVADHVKEFKRAHRDVLRNSLPIRINVNAGGFGAAIAVLIFMSALLGFAYIRTQARLDGLYDRIDAIYMMAPQLQHTPSPKEPTDESADKPRSDARGQDVHQPQ